MISVPTIVISAVGERVWTDGADDGFADEYGPVVLRSDPTTDELRVGRATGRDVILYGYGPVALRSDTTTDEV